MAVELGHSSFDFGSEMANESLDGPSGGVAQSADGVAFDLLGQLPQGVDLVGMRVAFHESIHHFQQPRRALSELQGGGRKEGREF